MNLISVHMRRWITFIVLSCLCCHAVAQSKRPHLFFTKERLELLKQRIGTDTSIAGNWKEILHEADNLLKGGNAKAKIDYLSLAYLVTGKKEYADKIKESLLQLCSRPTWSNPAMLERDPPWTSDLQTAGNCWAVAI